MPTDTGPLTVGYALGAIATALILVGPLLLLAYLHSDAHRRRMSRIRRSTRQENRP